MNRFYWITGMLLLVAASFTSCDLWEEDEEKETTGSQNTNSVNILSGLLQYYTFNENNANNMMSGDYKGVLINDPDFISDTPNGKGKALFLNSTKGQYVNIPMCPVNGSASFSVLCWLKDFGTGGIISTIDGNTIGAPTFNITEDIKVGMYTGSYRNVSFPYDITRIQSNGWHHVAITVDRDNEILYLYIDGVLVDNTSQSIYNIKASGTKMQIGGNADGNSVWTDPMKIDNVRIYNRCINAAEVRTIYNIEKS